MAEEPRKKVLAIDDDPLMLKIYEAKLKKFDIDVTAVKSFNIARDLLKNQIFDLILLDILMPDISGLEALKEIRQQFDNVALPVIMVTTMDTNEDIIQALKLGANDYLNKPINVEVALARMNTQIKIAELHKKALIATELDSVKAMIVTYNHELNTPLTVALGNLNSMKRDIEHPRVEKIEGALNKLTEVVKKIAKLTDSTLQKDQYTETSKMYTFSK